MYTNFYLYTHTPTHTLAELNTKKQKIVSFPSYVNWFFIGYDFYW